MSLVTGRTGLALLLTLLPGLAACGFSPRISSGSLICGDDRACPAGYLCKAAGVCCLPGDEQGPCSPAGDGGAPGLATADAGAAPDAPSDVAAGLAPDLALDVTAGVVADSAGDQAPAAAPVTRRLVEGPVDLIGYGGSCTRARASASANRWCAFTRARQLWVLDVTEALARDVPCDGSDNRCLQLTSALATGDGLSVEFRGDTLIFSAEPLPSEDGQFRGGVHAWLPGWPNARRLTSANGVHCFAAYQAAAAWCMDRAAGGRFEVRAGPLAPAPALMPVKTFASSDVYGLISSDGSSFLFDEPGKGRAGALSILPVGNPAGPGAAVQISTDVERGEWNLSADGSQLHLLRANTGGDDRLSATLSMFDLVGLTGPHDLAERIGELAGIDGPLGTHLGVSVLQNQVGPLGVLKLFLGAPPREVTVGTSSAQYVVSPDGRFTVFTPMEDPATGRHAARIADHAAGSVCALQIRPQAYVDTLDAFSENGELVFWLDYPDPTRGVADGWMARSAACADKQKFASRLFVHYVLRDRGLLYLDEFVASSGGTLRVATWQSGMSWPSAGAVVIQDGVDPRLTVLEPDRKVAVFTSHQGGRAGLYAVKLPM